MIFTKAHTSTVKHLRIAKRTVMKNTLTLTFLFSCFAVFGQSWCAPGANWKYNYGSGFGTEGYVEISYAGDTLIGAQLSQKLSKQLHAYDWFSAQYIDAPIGIEYTYEENGVVYIRYNNDWDTLYHFNATVGESCRMAKLPYTNACDSNSFLTVIATGTTTINSTSLNYVVVEFNYGGGIIQNGVTDTIIEKIGFIDSYMLPYDMCNAVLDAQEGGKFRCYEDDNFATYQPNYPGACDYVVVIGVEENSLESDGFVAPNPASGQIEITGLSHGNFEYSISDAQGRIWLSGESEQTIEINNLPSGVYVLTLREELRVRRLRFVKE